MCMFNAHIRIEKCEQVRYTHMRPNFFDLMNLIIIILHLQALELEIRALTLIKHSLVMDILDTRSHIISASDDRSIRVLVLVSK